MPTATRLNQQVQLHEKFKQRLLVFVQYNGGRYAVSTPRLTTGPSAGGLKGGRPQGRASPGAGGTASGTGA